MLKSLTVIFAILLSSTVHAETNVGEDGLHKPEWLRETFRDMSEDLLEAKEEGKRLAIIFEQRGCIYCRKMHEEVFVDPEIDALIEDNYFIVQMNLFGDVEVTDFDGETLTEKEMAAKWGVVFTPTLMFFDDELPADGITADKAAVMTMPGAFGVMTTHSMFSYVLERGYEGDEHFQKYVARKISESQ